ncbi:SDR family NAD(P)-dependent oxidoreductase [Paenibacillus endoradicis]|uniref:SDR family NAD(P)-dependent oxidoreductase n=1 Tax=Paenibacillus endoradicis TaxID=2972487 RepID=UPI0021596EC2|nr:SDR family NAD(P)-dependent oxidoreductase [Paenibacillus endoradicis]MCR8656466.1 SDR family NAD(P)-dependent oxidoreductase [Paenibacillus endoradicis]
MTKVAIITGATRGIGRSIAIQLSHVGYIIVVNGTNQLLIDDVLHQIHRMGGQAWGYCGNVGDAVKVSTMIDSVIAKYGRIDVLIHNAGNLHDQQCLHMTDEQWHSVINVHLNGAYYCIQRALSHMQKTGGDILLMTSTAGLLGSIGQVNYSASKAGILGMVWTLAAELKRNRIRVNGISPAALTDMTRPIIEHMQEKCKSRNEPFPDYWKLGESDDIARFVVTLLSQQDADLTGEIFGVNGSMVTRWQKPEPVFVDNSLDSFFANWRHEKGKK